MFDESKTYLGKDGKSYTGKELNDAAKTIYSEASGSGKTPNAETRKKEKDAIMATLANRLNSGEKYNFNNIKKKFEAPKNLSDAAFGRNGKKVNGEWVESGYQFDGPQATRWADAHSGHINAGTPDCIALNESYQTVREFLDNGIATDKNGKTLNYDYFNSDEQSKEQSIRGDIIGGTRFRKGENWHKTKEQLNQEQIARKNKIK